MKKNLLLFILSLFFVMTGYSQQRSEQEALKIATDFVKESSSTSFRSTPTWNASLSLAYACGDELNLRSHSDKNIYYYVFNVENSKGFVIVSGDERAKDILGYSDSGQFDLDNFPENFRYWLSCYKEELEYLSTLPINSNSEPMIFDLEQTKATQDLASSISPLLGGIKWNQGAPYNNLCPVDNTTGNISVTGCVATGMAQVMRYHKWPATGTGSHSYTTTNVSGTVSATFQGTQYDWENMLETYTGSENATYTNAVATLMYHCGVSVEMDYTSGESGANSFDIPNALTTYFGYDPNIKAYTREVYNKNEWINILKTELSEKRPVLYSGRSNGGGHLFVCDGYDSKNRFHFNWGWSGSSDGYFEITALNPSSLGIGGGTGGGYNSSQAIFTGIQKPTGAPDNSSFDILIRGNISVPESEIARTGTFTVSIGQCGNFGVKTYNGRIGVILTKENGDYVYTLGQFTATGLPPGYFYNPNNFTNRSIPGSGTVPNGNYRIYPAYLADGTSDWNIIKTRSSATNYVKVTVTDSKIIFTPSTDNLPNLAVNSLEIIGNLYQDITGQFKVSITNTGGEYFDSPIAIYFQNKIDGSISGIVASDKYFIDSGETKECILSGTIPYAPGEYYIVVMYDPTNAGSNMLYQVGNLYQGTINSTPVVNTVSLSLTSLSFPDNSNVTPSTFNLGVKVKNTGDFYDGAIYLYYNTEGNSYRYHYYQSVILEPNEERTIYYTSAPPVEYGTQKLAMRYYDPLLNTTDWLGGILTYTFKEDAPTGINPEQIQSGNINIYPNPATDYISFKSEENVKSVRIFNMVGQIALTTAPAASGNITIPVDMLNSGSYIIHIETDGEIIVSKFIKR